MTSPTRLVSCSAFSFHRSTQQSRNLFVLRQYLIVAITSFCFLVQIARVTDFSPRRGEMDLFSHRREKTALSAISVARIRTNAGIGSTVSGRPHELRPYLRTLPMGRTCMTIARGALPLRGWMHETSPTGICSKAAFVWRVCVINVPLLRLNLEPSAAC